MRRLLHRGSSILIAMRLHRASSTSSTTRSIRLLQRKSSISITTPLTEFLHRDSSISIATILHRGSSISITMSLTVSRARRISQRIAIRMRRPAQRRLLNLAHFVLARSRNWKPLVHTGGSTRFILSGQSHPARTCPLRRSQSLGTVDATNTQAW